MAFWVLSKFLAKRGYNSKSPLMKAKPHVFYCLLPYYTVFFVILSTDSKLWNTVVTVHFTLCLAYAVYQVVLLFEAIKGEIRNPLEQEEGR